MNVGRVHEKLVGPHPQWSCQLSFLAADFDAEQVPQFVRSVRGTYDGRPVMDAEVDFSISDNPNFRFFFTPRDRGELKIEVEDTHDKRFTHSIDISEGKPLPGG